MEQNIVDPGSMGYFNGFQGGYYANPFRKHSEKYTDYKNGWDAGRTYLKAKLNTKSNVENHSLYVQKAGRAQRRTA